MLRRLKEFFFGSFGGKKETETENAAPPTPAPPPPTFVPVPTFTPSTKVTFSPDVDVQKNQQQGVSDTASPFFTSPSTESSSHDESSLVDPGLTPSTGGLPRRRRGRPHGSLDKKNKTPREKKGPIRSDLLRLAKQKHICKHCGQTISSLENLRRHHRSKHSSIPFGDDLQIRHGRPLVGSALDARKPHTCRVCNKTLFNLQGLRRHHKAMHSDVSPGPELAKRILFRADLPSAYAASTSAVVSTGATGTTTNKIARQKELTVNMIDSITFNRKRQEKSLERKRQRLKEKEEQEQKEFAHTMMRLMKKDEDGSKKSLSPLSNSTRRRRNSDVTKTTTKKESEVLSSGPPVQVSKSKKAAQSSGLGVDVDYDDDGDGKKQRTTSATTEEEESGDAVHDDDHDEKPFDLEHTVLVVCSGFHQSDRNRAVVYQALQWFHNAVIYIPPMTDDTPRNKAAAAAAVFPKEEGEKAAAASAGVAATLSASLGVSSLGEEKSPPDDSTSTSTSTSSNGSNMISPADDVVSAASDFLGVNISALHRDTKEWDRMIAARDAIYQRMVTANALVTKEDKKSYYDAAQAVFDEAVGAEGRIAARRAAFLQESDKDIVHMQQPIGEQTQEAAQAKVAQPPPQHIEDMLTMHGYYEDVAGGMADAGFGATTRPPKTQYFGSGIDVDRRAPDADQTRRNRMKTLESTQTIFQRLKKDVATSFRKVDDIVNGYNTDGEDEEEEANGETDIESQSKDGGGENIGKGGGGRPNLLGRYRSLIIDTDLQTAFDWTARHLVRGESNATPTPRDTGDGDDDEKKKKKARENDDLLLKEKINISANNKHNRPSSVYLSLPNAGDPTNSTPQTIKVTPKFVYILPSANEIMTILNYQGAFEKHQQQQQKQQKSEEEQHQQQQQHQQQDTITTGDNVVMENNIDMVVDDRNKDITAADERSASKSSELSTAAPSSSASSSSSDHHAFSSSSSTSSTSFPSFAYSPTLHRRAQELQWVKQHGSDYFDHVFGTTETTEMLVRDVVGYALWELRPYGPIHPFMLAKCVHDCPRYKCTKGCADSRTGTATTTSTETETAAESGEAATGRKGSGRKTTRRRRRRRTATGGSKGGINEGGDEHDDDVCHHGQSPWLCSGCGVGYCAHQRQRQWCRECGGGYVCEHGKVRYQCVSCKGSRMCGHGRLHAYCRECGGQQICRHDRRKYDCRECGSGSAFCEHGRKRGVCREGNCRGRYICEHGRRRYYCKECGGKGICPHGRQRPTCKTCAEEKLLQAQRNNTKTQTPQTQMQVQMQQVDDQKAATMIGASGGDSLGIASENEDNGEEEENGEEEKRHRQQSAAGQQLFAGNSDESEGAGVGDGGEAEHESPSSGMLSSATSPFTFITAPDTNQEHTKQRESGTGASPPSMSISSKYMLARKNRPTKVQENNHAHATDATLSLPPSLFYRQKTPLLPTSHLMSGAVGALPSVVASEASSSSSTHSSTVVLLCTLMFTAVTAATVVGAASLRRNRRKQKRKSRK